MSLSSVASLKSTLKGSAMALWAVCWVRRLAALGAALAIVVSQTAAAKGSHSTTSMSSSSHASATHSGGHSGSSGATDEHRRSPGAATHPGSHSGSSSTSDYAGYSAGRADHSGTHSGSKSAPGVKRDSNGQIARSPEQKAAFKKSHPCPSTGRKSGACPGYVLDHVVPLKRGGADRPDNMQWQTTAAAKAKDKIE